MQLSNQDAERLVREGFELFQQGRPAEARVRLDQVTATGRAGAQIWLLLAAVCRAQQDRPSEEAALDKVLEMEPQAVRAMIMKADCRAAAEDDLAAIFLYKKARRIAEGQTLPPDLQTELRRAETALAELDARNSARLEDSLAEQGLPPDRRSSRFQLSLDVIANRKRIYFQEPTGYYFPELPSIQFFDPAGFDWAPAVEAATDAVRGELLAAMGPGIEDFTPYIKSEPNQPRYHPLLDKKDWSALFLCENGERREEVIARFPETWKAMQSVPLPWIDGWEPTIMFSLLRAGTRIPAHTGTHNTRLVCHLPLIVPPGCGFRVGNEERQWEEGRLLIFDDTIEHEAWNDSGEDRVVLIFDIWRPEMSEQERREVSTLFAIRGRERLARDGLGAEG